MAAPKLLFPWRQVVTKGGSGHLGRPLPHRQSILSQKSPASPEAGIPGPQGHPTATISPAIFDRRSDLRSCCDSVIERRATRTSDPGSGEVQRAVVQMAANTPSCTQEGRPVSQGTFCFHSGASPDGHFGPRTQLPQGTPLHLFHKLVLLVSLFPHYRF